MQILSAGQKGIPKTGWKMCFITDKHGLYTCSKDGAYNRCYVKLQILGDCVLDGLIYATMYSSNKCRTSKAKVLKIVGLPRGCRAVSSFDTKFRYITGRIVKPKDAFAMRGDACASGIHFFRTKKEAVEYGR